MKYSDVLKEEERNKEKVYSSFESELQQVRSSAKNAAEYYESGAYDDQDAFMAAGAMFGAFKAEQAKQKLVKALYDKPYFAHIRMHDTGDDVDCFLSDNENLDSTMMVLGNADMMIVPFKLDRNRPFLSAAFHCYQAKTDEVIPVEVYDRRSGKRYSYAYKPELIRDVDVFRRTINNVVTYLPNEEESDVLLEADELLAQKLEENRNNAKLRNIIATLQLQQFDIIRTDVETSFVVQGCAGSGKTQCLIHRLFFLRDTLQESGWNRVLLITPTQLFRNYSAELIRRYRLESVANISIAEFYKELLDSFDRRFSSRQYTFELSEEYLPDTYLQQVCSPFQIVKIDTEIDKAISSYVAAGCRLTGRSLPDGKTIDIDFVNELVLALSGLIEKYDETEKSLSEDREYQEHRKELDRLEKELRTLNRKAESYMDTRKRLAEEKDAFEKLSASYNSALSDVNEEEKKSEEQHDELLRKLKKVVADIDQCSKTAKLLPLMDSYTALRDVLIDRIELRSDEARFAAEYKALLSSILEGCNAALLSFTKNQPPKKWMERQERQIRTNEDRIHEISEDIELTNLFIEDHNNWLSEHNLEEAKNQRKAYRAELERARYFLSRIESSVFEQEVWNALAPLKTECGIETLFIEQLPNGRQKQNRILYKSDLLFYLRIYTKLHRKRAIPDYNLICIDEGQDLHSITDSNLNHTGIYLYSKGKIMIHLTFDYKTDEKCTTPGQYLKYHRTFQGLSTRELAEKVGIVPATLVLYENDRHPIKYSTAVALANVLGIDRNRLLDEYTAFVDYPYFSLLKKVRQDLSLTQIQMAELIGIGQTSYSGWEREIRVPRRKEYDKILAALKKLRVNVDTYLCQSASI